MCAMTKPIKFSTKIYAAICYFYLPPLSQPLLPKIFISLGTKMLYTVYNYLAFHFPERVYHTYATGFFQYKISHAEQGAHFSPKISYHRYPSSSPYLYCHHDALAYIKARWH